MRDAVVEAYYPRALSVADSARTRAQAAYGIASAIAAALIAAGVFGDLDERTTLVQTLGIVSLAGWLTAAGLFLVAVSAPFHETPPNQPTADAFVLSTLSAASVERKRVEKFNAFASVVAAVAAALTVATFAFAVFDPPTEERQAKIVLTPAGETSVQEACGKPVDELLGELAPDDLEKEFVSIKLTGAEFCEAGSATIAVPRAQVLAVAFEP